MENNSYNTKLKKIILDYLKNNSENTYSIKDIETYLISIENPVNITTIYRNLEKLYNDNYLMKYVSSNGKNITYQYVNNIDKCIGHLHLQCMKCGKIVHLDCDYMEEIKEHILDIHNFNLECEKSILYGFCEKCMID